MNNLTQLPPGSAMDYPGIVLSPEEQFSRAATLLDDKVSRIITKYNQTGDIVAFSVRVQKTICLFKALGVSQESNSFSRQRDSREISPRSQLTDSHQILVARFTEAVKQKEQAAAMACQQRHFTSACNEFSLLAKALEHEKGSERYFFIQASRLALLLGQEMIGETIKTLLELEQIGIPHSFAKWHTTFRGALVAFVKEQFEQNERSFTLIRDKIGTCSKEINAVLSKESLQEDKSLRHYLGLLYPVQGNLDELGVNIEQSRGRYQELAAFCKLLEIDAKSHCDSVTLLYNKWNALNKSAIELLSSLDAAGSTEEKNKILRRWITANGALYNCSAEDLTALHSWALSLLGKLYFSNDLSERALEKTVALIRDNAQTLFRHLRAFPCDVQLCFGKYRVDMSLLVLATISERLEADYCSSEKIGELRGWSLTSAFSALAIAAQWKKSEKPKVDLSALIEETVVHTRDPEGILNELLTAFARNQYDFNLEAEDVVALFEIACYVLEMPDVIANLSINPLHTVEFEDQLSALLWLRLVQARRLTLPYSSLEKRLPALKSNEFVQWIRLYDAERMKIDPKQHHRLFFAIVSAAENLFEDRLVYTETEVAEIFSFVVELYEGLLAINVDVETKNKLDSKLIQFGCRCVARANSHDQYNDKARELPLTYLDAKDLDAIQPLLHKQGRDWLEQIVFPKLATLVLHRGLYAEGNPEYTRCAALTTLTMPLTGENSDKEVSDLNHVFPNLGCLTLKNGNVLPASLDAIRLSSLYLTNIHNTLDFSECRNLQQNLQLLSLVDVEVEPGSLRWVASSRCLSVLSLCAAEDARIGSLAPNKLVHAHPTLRALSLKVDCIDDDEELMASLPNLIDSHSTISSIALFTQSEQSLLQYLLRAQKAAFVQELAITCNENEELSLLSQFAHLTKITFHTDDQQIAARIQRHDFSECRNLSGYSIVATGGQTMYINTKK